MKPADRGRIKKFWRLGADEYNTRHLDVNPDGELIVREGNFQYTIADIVKKYGTSTEIVFPSIIEARVRDLLETFSAYIKVLGYRGKFFYHYAMKVNQNQEFVLPAVSQGANLDVASANELYLVKQMIENEKFHAKIRVVCNGPKTPQYLTLIEQLRKKGLLIFPIIEDAVELERLKKFQGEVGIRVNLNVRINGRWDGKFKRFGFTEAELLKLGKIRNLSILHYHMSSQIESIEEFLTPLRRAIALYAKLQRKNPGLDTIDMGGGAGVPYEKKKGFYSGKRLIHQVIKTAKMTADKHGVRHPNLITEWGRYVVAPAQMTIYRILAEKTLENRSDKKWYVIDGSFMNDLTDTWAIHQKWHVVPIQCLQSRKLVQTWLAGASCDSDDKYTAGGGSILLPRLADCPDLAIAILDTGAYQDSLASHHCLLSSPAKLIASDGEIRIARRRETPEDIGRLFGWS